MIAENWIDLECHPSTLREAALAIKALVRRPADAEMRITFRLDGDLSRIRIPAPRTPRIAGDLWQHTCFETFIAVEGQSAYHEFNFAPSGEWAVYEFSSYRNGSLLADEEMRPLIAVNSSDSRLELDAQVHLDRISRGYQAASLRVGLAAVIEDNVGLSYWALRHPSGRPDFHDAHGFTMRLASAAT